MSENTPILKDRHDKDADIDKRFTEPDRVLGEGVYNLLKAAHQEQPGRLWSKAELAAAMQQDNNAAFGRALDYARHLAETHVPEELITYCASFAGEKGRLFVFLTQDQELGLGMSSVLERTRYLASLAANTQHSATFVKNNGTMEWDRHLAGLISESVSRINEDMKSISKLHDSFRKERQQSEAVISQQQREIERLRVLAGEGAE